jgi:SAM-dependent methyltransferase
MKIIDKQAQSHPAYKDFYDAGYHYFYTASLRSGDAFPAVCYAHDIFDCADQEYTLKQQFDIIQSRAERHPKSILEIGSGRGEVSVFFHQLGCEVFSIDCNPAALEFQTHTAQNVFRCELDDRYVLGMGVFTGVVG